MTAYLAPDLFASRSCAFTLRLRVFIKTVIPESLSFFDNERATDSPLLSKHAKYMSGLYLFFNIFLFCIKIIILSIPAAKPTAGVGFPPKRFY